MQTVAAPAFCIRGTLFGAVHASPRASGLRSQKAPGAAWRTNSQAPRTLRAASVTIVIFCDEESTYQRRAKVYVDRSAKITRRLNPRRDTTDVPNPESR